MTMGRQDRDGEGAHVGRGTFGESELLVLSYPPCPPPPEGRLAPLTEAERAVTLLAAAGASDRQIATRRGTSRRTVANQLRSVYRKLGVASRQELTLLLHGAGRP